jgi:hypothetical protein
MKSEYFSAASPTRLLDSLFALLLHGEGDGLTWTTLETCGLLWKILDFSGLWHLFHHMVGTKTD